MSPEVPGATTRVSLKQAVKYDVFIGRPSKWGNPYKIGVHGTRRQVVEMYRKYILRTPELLNSLHELKGKVLACYCWPWDQPCHGDVLIGLADLPEVPVLNPVCPDWIGDAGE